MALIPVEIPIYRGGHTGSINNKVQVPPVEPYSVLDLVLIQYTNPSSRYEGVEWWES
eukprot:COSAG03_NODE_138_length_11785_cov_22.668835_9_plen_57_part_00